MAKFSSMQLFHRKECEKWTHRMSTTHTNLSIRRIIMYLCELKIKKKVRYGYKSQINMMQHFWSLPRNKIKDITYTTPSRYRYNIHMI